MNHSTMRALSNPVKTPSHWDFRAITWAHAVLACRSTNYDGALTTTEAGRSLAGDVRGVAAAVAVLKVQLHVVQPASACLNLLLEQQRTFP